MWIFIVSLLEDGKTLYLPIYYTGHNIILFYCYAVVAHKSVSVWKKNCAYVPISIGIRDNRVRANHCSCYTADGIATGAIDCLTPSEQCSPLPHCRKILDHISNYTVSIKHLRPEFQNFRHSSSFSRRKHRHWCLSPVPVTCNFLPSPRSLTFFFFFFLLRVVAVSAAPFPCTDSKSVFSELQKPSVS